MQHYELMAIALALLAGTQPWAGAEDAVQLAKPTPEQVEWQDMELEMFVCLRLETGDRARQMARRHVSSLRSPVSCLRP